MAYPYSHSDAVDNDTWSTAALHNQQGQAIRDLVNALPVFKVDPDDTAHCYETVNAAVSVADLVLGADESIVVLLASGKNHALDGGTITLPDRPVFIKGMGGVHIKSSTFLTTLTGNIVLTAADSASDRLVLVLRDLRYNGNITGASNWEIQIQDCHFDSGSTITRTHGTNGCIFRASGLYTDGGSFGISDTDAASTQNNARVHIQDSFLSIVSSPPAFDFAGTAVLMLTRVIVSGFTFADTSLIDAANATFQVDLNDVFFEVYIAAGKTLSLISNGGNSTAYFRSVIFDDLDDGGGSYAINPNLVHGEALVQGLSAPVNPFTSLKWHDREMHETLTWNGTYWVTGG